MANRVQVKNKLREVFGDRCYWCGKTMHIPKYGMHDPSAAMNPNVETLEHHLQKKKGSKLMMHLRLAHRGCNI